MLGLCFSIQGCFSFKKLFVTFIYTSLFSIDIKKSYFMKFNQSMINEKLSILEFARLSPS